MTRILATVTLVALLLVSGAWLTRQADARAQEEAEAQAAEAQEEAEAALNIPGRPEGYTLVPFLTEKPKREFEQADGVLDEGTDYQTIIETNKGVIRIDLYEERAPATVNNFVFLARNHYYDGVVFHRVLEDFMAQTGDPTGTGTGGPGYQFDNEVSPELTHDQRGVVSMANAGPDTNGSQFFITFGPTPQLDGGYSVFGQVVEGDEVLSDITRIDPQTPSAVVQPSDTLAGLAEQGIELTGDAETEVEAYLEEKLGTLPAVGQTFDVDEHTGVAGRQGQERAYGFFPQPDRMVNVYIVERSPEAPTGGAETGGATGGSTGGASGGESGAEEPADDSTDEPVDNETGG